MENKTGKYLKYAIGEIVLVVIGILIALQINNWNQERKERSFEKGILKNLRIELDVSLAELRLGLKSQEFGYESTQDVYSYVLHKPIVVDSMYEDFYNITVIDYFFPKTSTFTGLKAGKLDIIKSDSLRDLITDIYEFGYQRLLTKENTRRNAGILLFPYYQSHFRTKQIADRINPNGGPFSLMIGIPNNYTEVIDDPEFETLLVAALHGRTNLIRDYKSTIGRVERCITIIDNYLSRM